MTTLKLSLGLAMALCANLAQAQNENSPAGSVYVEGSVCVSSESACEMGEAFASGTDLKIKDTIPTIYFENSNFDIFDNIDWSIRTSGNRFGLFDRGSSGGKNTEVFSIQANAPENAFRIATSGNAGFGTQAPSQAVDVQRSGGAARFQLTAYTNAATEAPQYIQRRSRGSSSAPTALQNFDNLGLFSFRGYDGVTMTGSRAAITVQAAGNWSDSSTPTRILFGTTPEGETLVQTVLEITPDGQVRVNGQSLNVPDYVFEDDYVLMPLNELRAFIDENGHLPGIAPAHEVNDEGLDLAGSQMGQLQKIEELTLYTLEQEEQLVGQSAEIEVLRMENTALREQLALLQEGLDEVRRLNGLK